MKKLSVIAREKKYLINEVKPYCNKLTRLLFEIFVGHLTHTVNLGIGITEAMPDILYKMLRQGDTNDLCNCIKDP